MKKMTGHLFVAIQVCLLGHLFSADVQAEAFRDEGQLRPSPDPASYVNPFIGTDGTGHTFPGATYPLGMVQPSPDTNNHSWDHTSGYQYQDETIMGFSQNHLSGTGISDLGDVLLQPFSGELGEDSYRSGYTKATETASPGYYSVELTDHNVRVELTASEHVALHRYRFGGENAAHVLVDLQHGIVNEWIPLNEHVVDSDVRVEDVRTISGVIETRSWVQHKMFFVVVFSSPVSHIEELERAEGEQAPRYVARFDDLPDDELLVKVALSTVSVDGAKSNMIAQVPDWDFDAVAAGTRDVWNTYLSRIRIEAPRRQKEIFYTALYHLFVQPNNTADVDGRYRGFDDRIYSAAGGRHFSTFSLWDTYRAAHPLYTIIAPEVVDDFVNSLIAQHEVQGFLPIWGLMNKETYTMIGNHGVPVVVDAALKGINGIDVERAYRAVLESLTVSHKNSDWEMYERFGYYPFDLLDKDGESVSRTLESSYDDSAAARLARHLGYDSDYERFARRAGFFQNLFDQSTGFMRGKDSLGDWREDFDPIEPTSPMNNPGDYTEANAYQYSWAAQHAVDGMIELFGSDEAFVAKLDEFFTIETRESDIHLGQEAMIGQYAHGNEPSHHVAYLYQFAGRPEKTAQLVTEIYESFYDNTPDGIQGNEDCGQMSAWYIFSTLGFYPVDPADGRYIFGAPQVDSAEILHANGRSFRIERESSNSNRDRGVSLNGRILETFWVSHEDVMADGELVFR